MNTSPTRNKMLNRRRFATLSAVSGGLFVLSGCIEGDGPAASVRQAKSPARGAEAYVWAHVELINYDHAGGIVPCVHVGPDAFDEGDVERLFVHLSVSYLVAETGQMVLQVFDVPLSETTISSQGDDIAIEVDTLTLGAEPDADTLAVTAELTSSPRALPDFWWAAVQDVEVDRAWGINPCVHVARDAHATASTNPLSLRVAVSYETARGERFEEHFTVPLADTEIMFDDGGPLVGVEPAEPLQLAAEPVASTLLTTATLTWA